MLLALAMRRGVRAFRAKQVTAAQRDRHQHTIALEAHRANPHPRQINQTTECSRDAHGQRPPTRGLEHHRAYGLTRARLPSPPAAPASRPRAEQDTGPNRRGPRQRERPTANGERPQASREQIEKSVLERLPPAARGPASRTLRAPFRRVPAPRAPPSFGILAPLCEGAQRSWVRSRSNSGRTYRADGKGLLSREGEGIRACEFASRVETASLPRLIARHDA